MQDKIQIGRFINGLPNGDLRRAFTYKLQEVMMAHDSDKRPYHDVSEGLLKGVLNWADLNKGRSLNGTELDVAIHLAQSGLSLKSIAEVFDVSLFSLTVHHGIKLGAIINRTKEDKLKLLKTAS